MINNELRDYIAEDEEAVRPIILYNSNIIKEIKNDSDKT